MAREVLDDVFEIAFPRALVNAYLVQADVPTLIDTGTPGGAGKVIDALSNHGFGRQGLARILLTHRHGDHAGNAAELARQTEAEVHVSPTDAPYVREGREQPRPLPATPLGRVMVPYVKVALPWQVEPATEIQETLEDEARVGPFRVIATPGHTEGHISLLWEERGVLFTGDAAARITSLGPHPAADDLGLARRSFARLAEFEFAAACFGHGRTLKSDAAAAFRRAV